MKYYIVRLRDSQTDWEYRVVKARSESEVRAYFSHVQFIDIYAAVDNIVEIG